MNFELTFITVSCLPAEHEPQLSTLGETIFEFMRDGDARRDNFYDVTGVGSDGSEIGRIRSILTRRYFDFYITRKLTKRSFFLCLLRIQNKREIRDLI